MLRRWEDLGWIRSREASRHLWASSVASSNGEGCGVVGGSRMSSQEIPFSLVLPHDNYVLSGLLLDLKAANYLFIFQVASRCCWIKDSKLVRPATSTQSLMKLQFVSQRADCYHQIFCSTALSASSLDKFLVSLGRQPSYVDLEANPVVGKDNPPDLADLVPSGVTTLSDTIANTVTSAPTEKVVEKDVLPAKKSVNHPVLRSAKYAAISSKICLVLLIWNFPLPASGDAKSRAVLPKKVDKVQRSIDPLAEATDIEKLVKEILNKTSTALLTEVTKELNDTQIRPSVVDVASRRVSSDLEHMIMSLKNAAYTQGFHAGLQATLRPNLSSQK
ncbi:hypothetical protein ZIOFF_034452 [Zingiber officinale]|uniref:Uncharacterized protein n=1 Tax=Zingiber officinale TaxID=94328 RepID=A0A8J5LCV4_ZINOF|nr:hypothetical protein ZIOFF_034452 [Zingiber officinale]